MRVFFFVILSLSLSRLSTLFLSTSQGTLHFPFGVRARWHGAHKRLYRGNLHWPVITRALQIMKDTKSSSIIVNPQFEGPTMKTTKFYLFLALFFLLALMINDFSVFFSLLLLLMKNHT
ncbi:membrane-associated protein, putative [Bodo saltans]|uniref:Membrane-associated protein, putative n=1 Tax=Bodo saltans TaxID=75058 RepID=A0A0S4JCP3_BODSA|nr:membrane-associated protein, putative [Bodo saltans]|eukprot:CUG88150.1 membrane-associated protein, putative [Bodo saltans]